MADIKEVYDEAKGNGFDVKVLRQVIRIRKQDRQERQEMESDPGNLSRRARRSLIGSPGDEPGY